MVEGKGPKGGKGGDAEAAQAHEPEEGHDDVPPTRDGDGMWNIARGDSVGRFFYASDVPSCVLRADHAGKWASAVGERTFDSGVHYFAVRVNSCGGGPVTIAQLPGGWMVGVGEKNFPLTADIQAGGRAFSSQPLTLGAEMRDPCRGALWAAMLSPKAPGKTHGSIVVQPPSIALNLRGRNALAHDAQVMDGDVIGVRADVDKGEVSFSVNGKRVKHVKVTVRGGGWVAVASSCTAQVKFTMLREEEHSKLWSDSEWQEILISREAVGDSSGGELKINLTAQLSSALCEGRADEADNLLLQGVQVSSFLPQQLTLPEVVRARDTLLRILAHLSPEEEGVPGVRAHAVHRTHPAVYALQDAQQAASEARGEVDAAEAGVFSATSDEEQAKAAHDSLAASLAQMKVAAGSDLGVALDLEAEARRLSSALAKCSTVRRRAEEEAGGLRKEWLKADRERKEKQGVVDAIVARKEATVLRSYSVLVDFIQANTAKRPTFSAPDDETAALRRRKIKLGETFAANEALAATLEFKTGEVTVIVMSATEDARIYYTTDGSRPVASTRSMSVQNGGKIRLDSSAVIKAIAFSKVLQPSDVSSSPEYQVRCGPPQFIASGKVSSGAEEGKEKDAVVRVMLKSVTPHTTIYYSFNSRDSTPLEFAIDGGQPTKNPPYGTGPGRRDGSKRLVSDGGSPRPDPLIAGSVANHEMVKVSTSGTLTAFASKDGLEDSQIVSSQLFTVAFK